MEMNSRQKQSKTGKPRFTRPAWGLSFAALAIAFTCAAYGPQNVLAAVRTLIGYIPGIGFVEQDDSTLYLEKPVSVTQEGVTLTVEQAVADANGIVVSFHIDGLPEPKPGEIFTCVYSDNRLLLPDGKDRRPIGGGIAGTQARIEFAPLPAGVKQVTLIALGEADCPAPVEWSVNIPLGKVAPQPALPVMDVTEVSTPPGSAADQLPTPENASASDNFNYQIQVSVEKTVGLADGWLVTGHIDWDDPDIMNMYVPPEYITVTDAAGKPIPVVPTDDGYSDGEFGFFLKQKEILSPVKMTISRLFINGMLEKGPEFTIDAGTDPQPGKEWAINQTLEVFGMPVTIVKANPANYDNGLNGFAFTFKLPQAITNIDLRFITKDTRMGAFGEGRPLADHMYLFKMGFSDGAPEGRVTFAITNMQWEQKGNWETSWNMPGK
jgi:hypothetical protein